MKKPESEEVTNDSVKKKNNSTINNQPAQLSITAVLEKNNVQCHSLSFDESINKKIQLGQMYLYVRFRNASKKLAETRSLPPSFLELQKLMTSLKSLKRVSKKIHKANDLLQIASDGPNVNLLFLKLYEEKRCLNELPALVDIGTFGIHTIHGSLKHAEKGSEWDAGKVPKFISKYPMDSPARRKTCEKI